MYVGTKRSPEKVISLWVLSFGLYGIYWLAKTFSELHENRKQGISGASFATLAVLFPPLAISACWLLPDYVSKLYAENGKLEHISTSWGTVLVLPTLAIWAIVAMVYLIVSAGGSIDEFGMYTMAAVVINALAINTFLLYSWLKKIQDQINEFVDEENLANSKA